MSGLSISFDVDELIRQAWKGLPRHKRALAAIVRLLGWHVKRNSMALARAQLTKSDTSG